MSSCDMWFGTREFQTWVPTPLSGADVSPSAWGDNGTLLNGGGYAINSRGSHKRYDFSWRKSSARETAQLMKSFYDGAYGDGKIYFQDPLTYSTNILPARWANPSITHNYEGPQLSGVGRASRVKTSGFRKNMLPVYSMEYTEDDLPTLRNGATFTEDLNAVYIAVPENMDLYLSAFHESNLPDGGVFLHPDTETGVVDDISQTISLTQQDNSANALDSFQKVNYPSGYGTGQGFWLFLGKVGSSAGEVTLTALQARLVPKGSTRIPGVNHWVGGQGNAGTRFANPPTYINHTGVNGGQVEFAATFVESVI